MSKKLKLGLTYEKEGDRHKLHIYLHPSIPLEFSFGGKKPASIIQNAPEGIEFNPDKNPEA